MKPRIVLGRKKSTHTPKKHNNIPSGKHSHLCRLYSQLFTRMVVPLPLAFITVPSF
jgi:hypothetical protein